MYERVCQFFGLRENPFHVSPDPRFFFCNGAHARAFSQLTAGVETRQGLVVLVGEPGTGKTILLHHVLNWLQERKQSSCYVFQSQLKPLELFEAILHDFGVACDSRRKGDILAALNSWLLERHEMGDSPVLIIDEAQAIWLRTLDRLRMLLNLETPGSKLLQIVLAGQTQLEEKLRRPELRQLQQRMMFRCRLEALSFQGTSAYIKHRLTVCGASDREIFARDSVEAVQLHAEGIPRVINLLCEHALLRAYTEKSIVVTPEMITGIAEEFELVPQGRGTQRPEMLTEMELHPASQSEKKTRTSAMAAALGEPGVRTGKAKPLEKPPAIKPAKKSRLEPPRPPLRTQVETGEMTARVADEGIPVPAVGERGSTKFEAPSAVVRAASDKGNDDCSAIGGRCKAEPAQRISRLDAFKTGFSIPSLLDGRGTVVGP
jgi:general secretion pathway protein A